MKAWYLSIKDSDEGSYIVFADTRNQARAQADSHDMFYDSWIEIEARRAPDLDAMSDWPQRKLDHYMWREKEWRWLDIDTPEQSETTDEEFFAWYDKIFG